MVQMSSPAGTGVAEVHFSDFQTVSFQMGTGNDVITITQTPNNSTVTVNAGGGDDTVSVGAANGMSHSGVFQWHMLLTRVLSLTLPRCRRDSDQGPADS